MTNQSSVSHAQPVTTAKTRLLTCLALGVVASAASAPLIGRWQFAVLIGWDVAALVFVVWVWTTIWPLDPERTAAFATREDPSRGAAEAILVSASVASLVAVGLVLVAAASAKGTAQDVDVAFGLASVIVSWLSLHTVFTLNYARIYHDGEPGGIDFNQPGLPAYSDFAYFAFTVGMTFQVSDTNVRSREIRRAALRQGLLSYAFGTGIVATTVNLVATLTTQ